MGSLVAQKRPDTRPKCVVTIIPAQSDQSVAVGTKSGPRWPSEDLWNPQKGNLGQNRALLGSLVAQKRPDTVAEDENVPFWFSKIDVKLEDF